MSGGSPPVNPVEGRVHDDNLVLNELKRIEYDSRDEFGKRISDGTRNNLDIASQYKFSPERLRLFKNGTRQFVQYNSIAEFTDSADSWDLEPGASDTVHLESAESSTYVVNYVLQGSMAFQTNQSLASGDVVKWGLYNDTDGWFMEQRGSDHTASQVDIKELRGGSETTLASDVELSKPITDWTRHEIRYNWYGVGNQVWRQTYTQDGRQYNDYIAYTSKDGDRGPETGNLNTRYEVQASSSTTDLKLIGGSMGLIALGDPTSLTRDKPQYESITVSGTADAWEPILAVRINPNDSDVNMQLTDVAILNYGANANIELVAVSFDASKTDASGWGVPDYHHSQNSALQSTTNVSQVADDTGSVKDFGTSDKFGGWTMAASIDIDGGNASGTAATANRNRQEKKAVLNSDHVVFLARTGTMDSTLDFVWDIDQNF